MTMNAVEDLKAEEAVLRTPRLVLAPLSPAHAPRLRRLIDDWDVVRMLAVVPWPITLGDVEAHARAHAEGQSEADEFAIVLDGAPIGVGSVKRPGSGDPPREMPRLGYWLGRPYWGQGYMTEAVSALTAYAFDRYPSDRLGAGAFEDNPASRRVLEKCGLRCTGSYKLHSRARDTEVETFDMQLTRAAWEKARR
jgi:RimJ/RimL family protein N-acetyltransferase